MANRWRGSPPSAIPLEFESEVGFVVVVEEDSLFRIRPSDRDRDRDRDNNNDDDDDAS